MGVIGIKSNISALTAQKYLDRTTKEMSATLTRLSSGMRINRASDDAAGLSVADSLRSKARLYTVASRNINDGISALNIASDTLSQQAGIVQRLMEIAEQSANGTFSAEQRTTMQAEYSQLVSEFGRLGTSTKFNKQALLLAGRGSNPSQLNLQVGTSGATGSRISVSMVDTGQLSGTIREFAAYGDSIATVPYTNMTFDQLVNNTSGMIAKISFNDNTGIARSGYLTINYQTGGAQDFRVSLWLKNSDLGASGELLPDGETYIGPQENYTLFSTAAFAVDSQTRQISGTGFTDLSYNFGAIASSGGNFQVNGNLSLDLRGLRFLTNSRPTGTQTVSNGNSGVTSIDFTGVETMERSRSSLTILRARLSQLNGIVGQFGATQSRLQSALEVVGASRENSLAAESRVRDADVGFEAAQLVAQQIRQQSAAQVLSLASIQPQIALSLLR